MTVTDLGIAGEVQRVRLVAVGAGDAAVAVVIGVVIVVIIL